MESVFEICIRQMRSDITINVKNENFICQKSTFKWALKWWNIIVFYWNEYIQLQNRFNTVVWSYKKSLFQGAIPTEKHSTSRQDVHNIPINLSIFMQLYLKEQKQQIRQVKSAVVSSAILRCLLKTCIRSWSRRTMDICYPKLSQANKLPFIFS